MISRMTNCIENCNYTITKINAVIIRHYVHAEISVCPFIYSSKSRQWTKGYAYWYIAQCHVYSFCWPILQLTRFSAQDSTVLTTWGYLQGWALIHRFFVHRKLSQKLGWALLHKMVCIANCTSYNISDVMITFQIYSLWLYQLKNIVMDYNYHF